MLCSKCGTENIEQTEYCIHCKESLQWDTAPPYPRVTHINMQSDTPVDKQPVVSSVMNLCVIAGSLFFPIIGMIMGLTYLRKMDPAARKVGKTWLALGFLFLLTQIVLISLN